MTDPDALIDALQTSGKVLCWTMPYQPHWAVHPGERRQVEARWMKRGGWVRCRWQREGTDVRWETQHDLKWLRGALAGAAPIWRARGRITLDAAD